MSAHTVLRLYCWVGAILVATLAALGLAVVASQSRHSHALSLLATTAALPCTGIAFYALVRVRRLAEQIGVERATMGNRVEEPFAQRHRWVFALSFTGVAGACAVVSYFLAHSLEVGIAITAGGLGLMILEGFRQRGQTGMRGKMVVWVIIYGTGVAVILAALTRQFRILDLVGGR